MKAKRFSVHVGLPGRFRNVVLATDYDALLELARRLRKTLLSHVGDGWCGDGTICVDVGCTVLRDSKWLEE